MSEPMGGSCRARRPANFDEHGKDTNMARSGQLHRRHAERGTDIASFEALEPRVLMSTSVTVGYLPRSVSTVPAVQANDLLVATDSGLVRVGRDTSSSTFLPTIGSCQGVEVLNNRISVYLPASRDIVSYSFQGVEQSRTHVPAGISFLNFTALSDGRFALADNVQDAVYFIDQTGTLLRTAKIQPSPDKWWQEVDGVQVGNRLILSEDGNSHVLSIDLSTYDVSVLKDLSSWSGWIGAISYCDGVFYLCQSQRVLSFTEGGPVSVLSSLPEGNLCGIAVSNGNAYVTTNFSGDCYTVDLATGNYALLARALDYPMDIEPASGSGVPVVPSLSISDAYVTEGNFGLTQATLTVSLAAPATTTVTVDWATSPASTTSEVPATPGIDYVSASGRLTFPPGVTSQQITVSAYGDRTAEFDEGLHVDLSNPAGGAVLDRAAGTVTIMDDDRQHEVVIGTGYSRSCTYADANGALVTVTMLRGTAALKLYDMVGVPRSDLTEIRLGSDTTAKSQLSVAVAKGGTTRIGAITGPGTIGIISAPGVILDGGGLSLDDGYVASLRLGGLQGVMVSMPGTGCPAGVTLDLGRVGDGSNVAVGSPIKSLKAVDWVSGTLRAPWVASMAITGARGIQGDCGIDAYMSGVTPKGLSLGTLNVAGILHDATIRTMGSIGTVVVAAAVNSAVLAGVDEEIGWSAGTDLPLETFAYGWTIKSFQAKSVVAGSGIARQWVPTEYLALGAWTLGKVDLGQPSPTADDPVVTIATSLIQGKSCSFLDMFTGKRLLLSNVVTWSSAPSWLDIDPASVAGPRPSPAPAPSVAKGSFGVRLQAISSEGDAAVATIRINGQVVAEGPLGVTYDRASDPNWTFYPAGTRLEISVSDGYLTYGSQIFIINPRTGEQHLLFDNAMGQDLGARIVVTIP
jgi:hypothetical protein